MGSTFGRDEQPIHRAKVASFELDLTEVTASSYQRCVEAGQCTKPGRMATCNFQPGKENHPINCVDWNQANTFCRWAGKRLPSEEEWEYAARGSDGRKYPWGDTNPEGRICWRRWKARLGTCEVGSFPSGDSPFGVHDLAGNVWEWTSSWFSGGYGAGRVTELRVERGGGWGDFNADDFRSSARGRTPPTRRSDVLGFRCAR
jgi:formylglycine-generating enzyme required for sulfatase activity